MGRDLMRDASWAQLGHVGIALRTCRDLILPRELPDELIERLLKVKAGLIQQLIVDFGFKSEREVIGHILIWQQKEISNDAVILLNELTAILCSAKQYKGSAHVKQAIDI